MTLRDIVEREMFQTTYEKDATAAFIDLHNKQYLNPWCKP